MIRAIYLACILLFIHAAPLLADTARIKVGVFPLEPINFIDSAGTAQGLHPSLLREIARLENWSLSFVPLNWAESLDGLQSGKIDLMVSVAYTPKRAETMNYSSEPAMEIWGQLFIRPDGQIKELVDLQDQRVAIMHKGINGKNFQHMAAELGIDCSYTAYSTLTDVLKAVESGRAAAGVLPQHFGLRYASQYDLVPSSIQFAPFPIYYTTKKGQNQFLLRQIDLHLKRWKQDKDSYYYQQLKHWVSGQGADTTIIPKWLVYSLISIAALALFLLGLSLLFKRQVRRKTAELTHSNKNLIQSEKRYRNLIESMVQPMILSEIICDDAGLPVDFRLLDVNPAFARIVGKPASEVIGKLASEMPEQPAPKEMESFGRVALSGTPEHFEIEYKVFGSYYDIVAYSPAKKQFVAVATDITERVKRKKEQLRTQEQMLHAQKLESLGVLAGGIAHDFNNILMAVLGHCELALRRMATESPAKPNIEEIKNAANKAAELANQMLAYSGKGKFVVEPLDLSKIVNEMQQMLAVSVSKKALLRYELSDQLASVEADATQLRQVILNLVINASDAIGSNNGVIAISTGAIDCEQRYLQESWLDEQLPAGSYVYLEVADTGSGMDKETVNRIFEPFFTTKFTGRGLGMAAVLGIVRGHNGAIKIYTEKDKGTTFKILLPAADKPAIQTAVEEQIEPLQGCGTVLLVDDDETILNIGQEMLEEFGYAVITAADGREALEKYQQSEDICFVLMDLTMPNMDGEQAFRELQRLNPKVKVIMSSGYNEQEVSQKFVGKGICGFLKKPYQLSALQKAIQSLVDRK